MANPEIRDSADHYNVDRPEVHQSHAEHLEEVVGSDLVKRNFVMYEKALDVPQERRKHVEFEIGQDGVNSLSKGLFEKMFRDPEKGINSYKDLSATQQRFIAQIALILEKGYFLNMNRLEQGDRFVFNFEIENNVGSFDFYRGGEKKFDNEKLYVNETNAQNIALQTMLAVGDHQMNIEGLRRFDSEKTLVDFATGSESNLYSALMTLDQKISLQARKALLEGTDELNPDGTSKFGPYKENIDGINKYLRLHLEHEKGLKGTQLESAMKNMSVKPDGTGYEGTQEQNLAWMRWIRHDLYGYKDSPFEEVQLDKPAAREVVSSGSEGSRLDLNALVTAPCSEAERQLREDFKGQVDQFAELYKQFAEDEEAQEKRFFGRSSEREAVASLELALLEAAEAIQGTLDEATQLSNAVDGVLGQVSELERDFVAEAAADKFKTELRLAKTRWKVYEEEHKPLLERAEQIKLAAQGDVFVSEAVEKYGVPAKDAERYGDQIAAIEFKWRHLEAIFGKGGRSRFFEQAAEQGVDIKFMRSNDGSLGGSIELIGPSGKKLLINVDVPDYKSMPNDLVGFGFTASDGVDIRLLDPSDRSGKGEKFDVIDDYDNPQNVMIQALKELTE